MGFPHCPICLSLAFFTFGIVITRSYLLWLLFREFAKGVSYTDLSITFEDNRTLYKYPFGV